MSGSASQLKSTTRLQPIAGVHAMSRKERTTPLQGSSDITGVASPPTAPDWVIHVESLCRNFGQRVAVKDVSFRVRRGAIFGLLGPNGSGKSTIIRMLLGILPATQGAASVLDFDTQTEPELIKPRVGYMSQQFSLYGDLTVAENIDFYGRIYGLGSQRLAQRRQAVCELTGIGDRLPQLARTLSGGWKQRLALACALIHEPDVIFLDEPTAGIDPVAHRDLWDLLFELSSRGVTLLVTTHYMDEAERCTDVGYLYLSRLLVVGKPDSLKQLPAVTPTGTVRYDLRTPDPTHQLTPLRGVPGVRDVTLFGERIHLLADQTLNAESILDVLHGDRSEIELTQVPPTLEDVFVTLTRSAEQFGIDQLIASNHANVAPADLVRTHAPPTLGRGEGGSDATQGTAEPTPTASTPPAVESDSIPSTLKDTPIQRRTHRQKPHSELAGLWAILVKEFYHIRRQPTTLFFMLVVPVMQTIIFGYAINTRIEHIPTVVLNLDDRLQSELLIETLVNSHKFDVQQRVADQPSFEAALKSGVAQVGLIIPPDFSDQLLHGEQTTIQVLIDGSDSQVATTAQNSAMLIGQNLSIQMARAKGEALQLAGAKRIRPGGPADRSQNAIAVQPRSG